MLRCTSARCYLHATGFLRCPSLVSFHLAPGLSQAPLETIGKPPKEVPEDQIQAYVFPETITEAEEHALLQFTGRWFDRLPFVSHHVDQLIHRYKEFYRPYDGIMKEDQLLCVERSLAAQRQAADAQRAEGDDVDAAAVATSLSSSSSSLPCGEGEGNDRRLSAAVLADSRSALQKARDVAHKHLKHIPLQNRVHFLQLHGDGFIRAHVDESRNSSGIVAGLTLGSGRVMTLTHPTKFPHAKIELCLQPRSFYVLTGTARYEWEHSVDWVAEEETAASKGGVRVVEGSEVYFAGKPTGMKRAMRTAVIFRGVSPMELLMQRMKLPHRHA